jgi:hypothetical protein
VGVAAVRCIGMKSDVSSRGGRISEIGASREVWGFLDTNTTHFASRHLSLTRQRFVPILQDRSVNMTLTLDFGEATTLLIPGYRCAFLLPK